MNLDSTMKRLVEGYRSFHKKHFEGDCTLYDDLVTHGQKPEILLIACCDSRVDPAIVFNCTPGDLFVVRNVANLVPPYQDDPKYHSTSAAMQFAVCNLKVKDIIIFGHSYCGGIQSLFEDYNKEEHSFISEWMGIAEPARDAVIDKYPGRKKEELCSHCEKESLVISYKNLYTFPWINERIENGDLNAHAWHFDIKSGKIAAYDEENKAFEII